MRVLWVVNTLMEDIKKRIGINNLYGGGWMEAYLEQVRNRRINISIVTPYKCDSIVEYNINDVTYYLIPGGEKAKNGKIKICDDIWMKILDKSRPDIIHIHGTEYAHSIGLLKLKGDIPAVTSIQGLLTNYERYYYGGIEYRDLIINTTIKDIIKKNTIFNQRKNFLLRSKLEKKIIFFSDAIIGRTDWDYSNVSEIKRNILYYKCNESLRSSFYTSEKWSISKIDKYSLFVSQATYPIKGFHYVLKAVWLLKDKYKDIKIYVAGSNIFNNKSKLHESGYSRYINKLIEEYGLRENVEFLGVLDECQMMNTLRKAHVFVQASTIENSPNSLGEAQLMGTPSISSFVGGVGNMIINNETGLLYNYQEYSILATYIDKLFSDDELARRLSKNSIIEASKRHDRELNGHRLVEIYNDFIKLK